MRTGDLKYTLLLIRDYAEGIQTAIEGNRLEIGIVRGHAFRIINLVDDLHQQLLEEELGITDSPAQDYFHTGGV